MAREFDIKLSHATVKHVVSQAESLADGMAQLFDFCRLRHPRADWSEIEHMDLEADADRLKGWLRHVVTHEAPGPEIEAFWFGLFEPIINGEATCGLYVAGAKSYDADDPGRYKDAFCGPPYFPEGRYADSHVLHKYYAFAHSQEGGVGSEADYTLTLGFAGLAVAKIISELPAKLLLGSRSTRSVAYGFDSGDCIPMGVICRDGLRRVCT